MNVIMLVSNAVVDDVRVMKEAKAVKSFGARVHVYGVAEESAETIFDSVEIVLAKKSPIMTRLIKFGMKYRPIPKMQNQSKISGPLMQLNYKKPSLKARIAPLFQLVKGYVIVLNLDSIGNRLYKSVVATAAEPIDVIHCHDLDTLAVGYRLKQKYNCTLIYDSHELWIEMSNINPYVKKVFREREARYIKEADHVISVSPSICDVLQERYGLAELPTQICNMPEVGEAITVTKPFDDDVKIIYMGYYIPGRGIEDIVKAVKQLPPHFKLTLRVQSNNLVEQLKQQLKQSHHDERISVLPFVPQDEVVAEISKYDIGILPYQAVSLNNYYCMPNKLFQYMAGGVCVVANDLPDVKRALLQMDCGLIYDSKDLTSLSTVLRGLEADRQKLYAMKQNARKAFTGTFNWSKEIEKLAPIYAGTKQ